MVIGPSQQPSRTNFVQHLELGETVSGSLGAQSYHTYGIEVPDDASAFTVSLKTETDLVLLMQAGWPVQSYLGMVPWNYSAISDGRLAAIDVDHPDEGLCFILITWSRGRGNASGAYDLVAR